MAPPALISIDWGTSSLRCALLALDGSILARSDQGPGIQPPPTDGFAAILERETAAWRAACATELPILMSGMIGSRQGWADVPYLPCPAAAMELAGNLYRLQASNLQVWIVPGLAIVNDERPPEVMRGEETQIIGALAGGSAPNSGGQRLFVLPGTHSKWATTTNGAIVSFATYMTGDVFAALRNHTILGRLMPDGPAPFDEDAFGQGVRAGAAEGHAGSLLNRLFATRTLGLFDRVPAAALESYLSGLLIGAEIGASTATAGAGSKPQSITIIGNAQLSARYLLASRSLHLTADTARPDCASFGHWIISKAAGLLKD